MSTLKELKLASFQHLLAPRKRTAHKGDFGHVLVIGGHYGMAGAVRMAGEAAARVGAGLVSIATHAENCAIVSAMRPELMCHGISATNELEPLIKRATVIVLGPGLGQANWSQEMHRYSLSTPQPKVVDADGLNLLSKSPAKQNHWILTPHVGEAARLLQCSTEEIQADRLASAQKIQQLYGGVVVLKGTGTLVVGSHGQSICHAGNPGMASGGMGDVLSGVIGGLLAQKLTLQEAAEVGVLIHSTAADLAATGGERGLLALDLMPHLRRLVNP